jgi:hypothetical protein
MLRIGKAELRLTRLPYVDALIDFATHMTLNRVTGIYRSRHWLIILLQHEQAYESIIKGLNQVI